MSGSQYSGCINSNSNSNNYTSNSRIVGLLSKCTCCVSVCVTGSVKTFNYRLELGLDCYKYSLILSMITKIDSFLKDDNSDPCIESQYQVL